MQNMKCCNDIMKDFSFYRKSSKRIPHFYCPKCHRRYFGRKYYTAEEWFFYVNGAVYDAYVNQF